MNKHRQQGFAIIEAILILVVVGIIGFTGWFVWHSKQVADDAQNKSQQASSGTIPASKVASYEECAKLKGSRILETYPEQCVTTSGTSFTRDIKTTEYCSKIEKLCLDLPSNWSVTQEQLNKFEDNRVGDSVTISRADSATAIELNSSIGGIGGFCVQEDLPNDYSYTIKSKKLDNSTTDRRAKYDAANLYAVAAVSMNSSDRSKPYDINVYLSSDKEAVVLGKHPSCDTSFSVILSPRNATWDNMAVQMDENSIKTYSSLNAAKSALGTTPYLEAYQILTTAHYNE